MAQVLRGYQRDGIAKITGAWREGARSVLGVAPTGSGKTSLLAELVRRFASGGAGAVILVHRRELATQASTRLTEFGVPHGMILPGFPRQAHRRVQIASVQTLVRREAPAARLVVCDEAHLSTAATWSKVLASYPESLILGLTATPFRLSGKPLAGAYDRCVVVATPRELREQGHLCPYAGFGFKSPDLSGVKTTGGDYNEKQSAEAMREPSIVANIVEQWQSHASDLSTVVFAVTIEHSKTLAAEFVAVGVAAEHLDGKTPLPERAAILKRVADGKTRVLVNVGCAVEGLDIPRLKCCVLARPTKSLARYLQMAGRVRRPWQGLRARIHDHSFCLRHGLPDDDRDYTLTADPEEIIAPTQCKQCFAYYRGRSCPECQHEPAAPTERRELVTVDDAEIFEFDSVRGVVAEAKPPPPVRESLPPVDVRWDNPGRDYEGIYLGSATAPAAWGSQAIHTVRGTKRDYRLPGTVVLNAFFSALAPETRVRVTYLGERLISGGRSKKEFTTEVDDGS